MPTSTAWAVLSSRGAAPTADGTRKTTRLDGVCTSSAFVCGLPQRTCPSPGSTRSSWSSAHVQARGRGNRPERMCGDRVEGALRCSAPVDPWTLAASASPYSDASVFHVKRRRGVMVRRSLSRSLCWTAVARSVIALRVRSGQRAQRRNRRMFRPGTRSRGVRTLAVSGVDSAGGKCGSPP